MAEGREARLRKIDNFLPSRFGSGIIFQKDRQAGWRFPGGEAASTLRTANDSGMAPQAVEIAQNGLGNGGRWLARQALANARNAQAA
jgi:hypothetical protein